MGQPMVLDPSMPGFGTGYLHDRTLKRWAKRFDLNLLEQRIMTALQSIAERKDIISFQSNSFAFASYVSTQANELIEGKIDSTFYYSKDCTELRFDTRGFNRLLEIPLSELNLDDCTIQVVMLIGTYRALIQQRQGHLPGSEFNLTMAGVVATAISLGVWPDMG